MVLAAGGAERSGRGAHDRDGLALPGVIAVWARGPVDGILEDAGDGEVVLGGGKEDGAGGADAGLELDDGSGRIELDIAVVERNGRQVEGVDGDIWRGELDGGAEDCAV